MRRASVMGLVIPLVTMAGIAIAEYPMRSFMVIPNFSGIGVGTRSWETPKWGWDVQVQPSWAFNDVFLRANVLYSPWKPVKAKRYLGAGLGFFSINNEYDWDFFDISAEYKVSSVQLQAFIGWEWLLGIRKQHGLSFEVGLQYGSADYEVSTTMRTYDLWTMSYTTTTLKQDGTFSLFPLYIGGVYTYYFKK